MGIESRVRIRYLVESLSDLWSGLEFGIMIRFWIMFLCQILDKKLDLESGSDLESG